MKFGSNNKQIAKREKAKTQFLFVRKHFFSSLHLLTVGYAKHKKATRLLEKLSFERARPMLPTSENIIGY